MLTLGLVLGLGALGLGCFVGIPYGLCWGVSFAYPPMREHLWAWTFGGSSVAGWRKVNGFHRAVAGPPAGGGRGPAGWHGRDGREER